MTLKSVLSTISILTLTVACGGAPGASANGGDEPFAGDVPEMTSPEETAPEVAPETPEAAPETPEETPEVAPETPEATPETPEVDVPKSDEQDLLPEETDPTPEVEVEETPDATPETPEVAPETPEATPETPEVDVPKSDEQDLLPEETDPTPEEVPMPTAEDRGPLPEGVRGLPVAMSPTRIAGTACTLVFNAAYVGDASTAKVIGTVPDMMSWGEGPSIADADGDAATLEWTVDADDVNMGAYELSFVGQESDLIAYVDYEDVVAMDAEARSYLTCDWWDGDTQTVLNDGEGECHVSVFLETAGGDFGPSVCLFTPNGNMGSFPGASL